MAYEKYASGTIKLKNTVGELIPFYPATKESCITDVNTGNNISNTVYSIQNTVETLSNSGGVKVTYNEVTENNASSYSNETMIAWIQPETWSYTVDTTKLSASNAKTSIPFNLFSINDASITVDWGDNTTSTFTKTDYPYSTALNGTSSTGLIHTYSEPGIYTVKVISDDFDKVKLYDSSSVSSNTPIYYYRNTLTEVKNAFPTLNVTNFEYCFYNCTSLTSIPTGLFDNNTAVTSFERCFYNCSSLASIPTGLFDNNTAVTNFSYCFLGCSSLTSISTGLFDNCTAVTTFEDCFANCSSLTSIPEVLFDDCTAVTNFSYCFYGCSSLTTIPTDLFKYNTEVTTFKFCFYNCSLLTTIPTDLFKYNTVVFTFHSCFRNCTSLTTIPTDLFKYNTNILTFVYCFQDCTSLTTIPADLFKYNTAVTTFSSCFYNCTSLNGFTIHIGSTLVSTVASFVTNKAGTTRTVYVPAGSTTQTTFNGVASSLGLTIIGE